MGFFDNLFSAFTGKPAIEAANQNKALFNENYGRGMGQLDTGFAGAKDAYGNAINAYAPLSALAGQFGQGTNMYLNSLGLNGQAGNDAARSAFQTGPGYDFAKQQALEASTRGAAARSGGAVGGNQLTALATLGNNLANQEYGGWQNRLQGLGQQQLLAQNAASGGIAGQYGNLANANMTDATNRVNLGNTTASANANQNNTAAQAQMQGNANMWGFGLNAAKLAMGMPDMSNSSNSLTSMWRSFNPQGQSNPNLDPNAYGMDPWKPKWAY
jgi:hypothetical protein